MAKLRNEIEKGLAEPFFPQKAEADLKLFSGASKLPAAVKVSMGLTVVIFLLGGLRLCGLGEMLLGGQALLLIALFINLTVTMHKKCVISFLDGYGLALGGCLAVLAEGGFILFGSPGSHGFFEPAALVLLLKTWEATRRNSAGTLHFRPGMVFSGAGVLAAAVFLLNGKAQTALAVVQAALLLGAADWTVLVGAEIRHISLRSAARAGIIIKNTSVLERLAYEKLLVLGDGMLTMDRVQVTNLITYGTFPQNELLALAAAVSAQAEQPIGKALARLSEERGVRTPMADSCREEFGAGMEGHVLGHTVRIGNRSWLESLEISAELFASPAARLAEEGKLAVFVAVDQEIKGLLGILYPISPQAMYVLQELDKQGFSVEILSGEIGTAPSRGVHIASDLEKRPDIYVNASNPEELLRIADLCLLTHQAVQSCRVLNSAWLCAATVVFAGAILLSTDLFIPMTGVLVVGTVLLLGCILHAKRLFNRADKGKSLR